MLLTFLIWAMILADSSGIRLLLGIIALMVWSQTHVVYR